MKNIFAELSCIALLWIGTAGVVASLYLGGAQTTQLRGLCEFGVVIAFACVAKMALGRDKSLNETLI